MKQIGFLVLLVSMPFPLAAAPPDSGSKTAADPRPEKFFVQYSLRGVDFGMPGLSMQAISAGYRSSLPFGVSAVYYVPPVTRGDAGTVTTYIPPGSFARAESHGYDGPRVFPLNGALCLEWYFADMLDPQNSSQQVEPYLFLMTGQSYGLVYREEQKADMLSAISPNRARPRPTYTVTLNEKHTPYIGAGTGARINAARGFFFGYQLGFAFRNTPPVNVDLHLNAFNRSTDVNVEAMLIEKAVREQSYEQRLDHRGWILNLFVGIRL